MRLNLSSLAGEEVRFLRRLEDLAERCSGRCVSTFTPFLSERQQHIAGEFIRQRGLDNAMLAGGYPGADRRQCGFFPSGEVAVEDSFPIAAVTANYYTGATLSHRDFLGSLLGLGLKRESIGDILAANGICTIFLAQSVASFVLQGLVTVGRERVSVKEGFESGRLPAPSFQEFGGTVGSARMDSLVKLLTNQSREKAAALIRSGLVKQNDTPVLSISQAFGPGDRVAIRGFGKYIIDGIGSPTRKGRLPVTARKYI